MERGTGVETDQGNQWLGGSGGFRHQYAMDGLS